MEGWSARPDYRSDPSLDGLRSFTGRFPADISARAHRAAAGGVVLTPVRLVLVTESEIVTAAMPVARCAHVSKALPGPKPDEIVESGRVRPAREACCRRSSDPQRYSGAAGHLNRSRNVAYGDQHA